MPDLGIIEEGGRVFKKLSNLHLSTSCSDVTLVLGDTKLVAHRFVLGANSSVFETFLFGTDFAEHNQKEVKVDAPVEAFKILLQYMYTGSLVLQEFDVIDVANFLELCHRYEILELQEQIENYLCVAVGAENAVKVLQVIKPLDIKRLEELCWYLIEMSIDGHYEVDLNLPYELLEELVFEKERNIKEINLFKFIDKSTKLSNYCTEKQKEELLSRLNLNQISGMDMVKIVKPSNCFSPSKVSEVLEEIIVENAKEVHPGLEIEKKAKLQGQDDTDDLFGSGAEFESIGETKFLSVDLGKTYIFNKLTFTLQPEPEDVNLSYIVKVSKGGDDWKKIVDYSETQCSGSQILCFPTTAARYIMISGTTSMDTESFLCSLFKIFYQENPSKTLGSLFIPTKNVADSGKAFVKFRDSNRTLKFVHKLVDGRFLVMESTNSYISQSIYNGSINVVFHQPYILSSCRFLLWDFDGRKYSFKVETTYDGSNFHVISDKSGKKVGGWQVVKFSPRPVICFRVTGISATFGSEIRLVHFEAPAQA